jgi:CarboxypepD_reg-like domain
MRITRQYIFSLLLFLSAALGSELCRAQINVSGKIMDNGSGLPLIRATVIDRRTGLGVLTDSLGNYNINARLNDWIIFSYIGYYSDSVQIKAQAHNAAIVNVFLRMGNFSLSELDVKSRRIDYERDSLERRATYGFALDQEKVRGLSAAAHPASALFDALSKKQKEIWNFQKMEGEFEQQAYIQSRIKISVVERLTDLHGDTLKLFLENYYHPDYEWVRYSSDYDLYQDIIRAANEFKLLLPTYPPLHDSIFMKSKEYNSGSNNDEGN